MTFTYTPEQAATIAARWNALADDNSQINASDAHHVFGDNADDDMTTHGVTLIEVCAMNSATGAPATFYVTSDDVSIETVADILASDVAARFDISATEASRIASMAKDGADFLRIWESKDCWRDAQAATVEYVATISHHSIAHARVEIVGSTLHAAKINATREFGGGYLDHVIEVIDSDGVVVASRRVGDKRWATS